MARNDRFTDHETPESTTVAPEATVAATTTPVFTGPIPEEREPNLIERGIGMAAQNDPSYKMPLDFAAALGADETQIQRLTNALTIAAADPEHDPRRVQTILAETVGTKTSSDLINAFEEIDPSLKPFLDVVRTDPALMDAVHNAVSKDITVLSGLQEMAADDIAKATNDQNGQSPFINALKDPTNRQLFTTLLNKVAEDPNLDFDDFKNVADAGIDLTQDPTNKAKQNRYMDSLLNGFGLKDRRAELAAKMGTPIEMLHRMWDDPHTFFDDMAEALGGDPAQIEALKGLGEFFANFVGMYSEDPYIKAFMAEYGPKLSHNISAISGGQRDVAGAIEQIIEVERPANKTSDKATPTTDDLVGAGTNITVGGVTLRSDFNVGGLLPTPVENRPAPEETDPEFTAPVVQTQVAPAFAAGPR